MRPDDEVCLCFHVTLRKIRAYLERENPPVASLISECLGAGTGCMWCVPFLKHLHAEHAKGRQPDLRVSPEEYARTRLSFHATKRRDEGVVRQATGEGDAPGGADAGAEKPPSEGEGGSPVEGNSGGSG